MVSIVKKVDDLLVYITGKADKINGKFMKNITKYMWIVGVALGQLFKDSR